MMRHRRELKELKTYLSVVAIVTVLVDSGTRFRSGDRGSKGALDGGDSRKGDEKRLRKLHVVCCVWYVVCVM